MPRIAVAIFVVVAVSVSIGINIARYPAVFVVAGSTHESLVSDDTMDVSETEETEGPVAISTLPSLPDKNLAAWNPPMVTGVKPTITEAVPHVASNLEYAEDLYKRTDAPYAEAGRNVEPSSNAKVVAKPYSEADDPLSSEHNHYEVELYRPYTEDRGEEIGDRREGIEEQEQEAYRGEKALSEPSVTPTENPAYDVTEVEGSEYHPAQREEQTPGVWPATVAESFHYHQESSRQASNSDNSSFYDHEPQTSIQNVSSTVPAATSASRRTSSMKKSPQQDDSAMIFEEKSDWEASVPMVAIRDTPSARTEPSRTKTPFTEVTSHPQAAQVTETKRLPAVQGADFLPGALPPSQAIIYPVTR